MSLVMNLADTSASSLSILSEFLASCTVGMVGTPNHVRSFVLSGTSPPCAPPWDTGSSALKTTLCLRTQSGLSGKATTICIPPHRPSSADSRCSRHLPEITHGRCNEINARLLTSSKYHDLSPYRRTCDDTVQIPDLASTSTSSSSLFNHSQAQSCYPLTSYKSQNFINFNGHRTRSTSPPCFG